MIRKGLALWAVLLMTLSVGAGLLPALAGANQRTPDSDNDMASATPVSSGVPVTGEVNSTDDPQDYFKISATAGKVLSAKLSWSDQNTTMGLYLLDPEGDYLAYHSTSESPASANTLISVNGTYYILVNALWGTSEYALNVTLDDPVTMTPGNTYTGTLDSERPGLNKWYRIWLNGNVSGQSEVAWVNMTADRTNDFDLAVYDILNFNGSQIYNLSWYGDPTERVSWAASYTGWYYVQASAYDGAGDYTLQVSKMLVPSDGNNDCNNATRVKHNAAPSDRVDQGWDHYDWYSYRVLAGDTLQVRVDRNSGTDVFNVSIFDQNMHYLIGGVNIQGSGTTGSVTLNLPAAPAETYYFISVSMLFAVRNNQITDDTAMMNYKITFSSPNHNPVAQGTIPDVFINEDESTSVPVLSLFSDPDEDDLSFELAGASQLTTLYNATSGAIDILPKPNWYGQESVDITVRDGFGGVVQQTMKVTVASVNDPPYIKKRIADVQMLQGGTDTSIDLSQIFSDVDIPYGDKLTYSVSDNGSVWVEISPAGKVTLIDPVTFYGHVRMTFTATDNASASVSATCNVTVQHVNQPPKVVNPPPAQVEINEDESLTLDMSRVFEDPENDPITIIPSGQSRVAVIVEYITQKVTLKPGPNLSGFTEEIKFTGQDDKGIGEAFVTVRVTVIPVNDPPKITNYSPSGEVTMTEMESMEFSVTATDIESPNLLNFTWFIDGKNMGPSDNSFLYQTNYFSAGEHVIKVVVDDGELEVEREWRVTVKNKNREPVEVKILSPKNGESFMEGTEISFEGTAKDPDGDALTYSWMDKRIELSDELSFTTSSLAPGVHTIYLEVSDGEATVKSKSITIEILKNNPPKVISYSPQLGQEFEKGKAIMFSVTVSDPENDPLSYTWAEGGRILSTLPSFTTKELSVGTHAITLTVSDGRSETTITLTVVVKEPETKPLIDSRTLMVLGGIVALVALVGIGAFFVMRRRRTPPPEASLEGEPAEAVPEVGMYQQSQELGGDGYPPYPQYDEHGYPLQYEQQQYPQEQYGQQGYESQQGEQQYAQEQYPQQPDQPTTPEGAGQETGGPPSPEQEGGSG
ncbi:MAG: tandem-95 repeat protein [Thermoplasmata archaeon]